MGFAGLFTLAGFVGRATIIDGRALSLVWPAAGIAVLWYLVEDVRWRSLDILALAGITFLVNTTTGSSSAMGWVFILANVVQALTVVTLCRRWRGGLWGDGPPMATTRSLMVLVAAAMVGAVVGATIGATGLWLTSDFFSVASTLTWWGRNAVGIIGVTVAGLLVLHQLQSQAGRLAGRQHARAWWIELTGVIAATGLMYLLELHLVAVPVSFLLPGVFVWVGMRFSPTVAALYGLIAGAGFVTVTLLGNGPFAGVESLQYSALLSQFFVALSVVIGIVLAIYRDQTTRLLDEVDRARTASEAQADVLATVIAAMSEGVCVLDPAGVVQMANPALELTLGVPVMVGTTADDAFALRQTDGLPLTEDEMPARRALAGQVVAGLDLVADQSSGSRVVNVFATPLGASGSRGAVVVVRDVTDERAHQRELTAFAGVVAHDLLNPITTVDGWAEHLADAIAEDHADRGADGSGALRMVQKIRASATRMRSLVEDLLAHATAGDRTLRPETLDLTSLATQVAIDRGVPHLVRVGPIPPILGDPVLVRQVIDNVFGNAVKYVAPGVEPEIEVSGACAPGGLVRVRIVDRGIGIPAGQHEAVFGDFQRAHAADYQGTGLGLAICRRVIERHGGTISAHPRSGGGTEMELTLPAAAAAAAAGAPAPPAGPVASPVWSDV